MAMAVSRDGRPREATRLPCPWPGGIAGVVRDHHNGPHTGFQTRASRVWGKLQGSRGGTLGATRALRSGGEAKHAAEPIGRRKAKHIIRQRLSRRSVAMLATRALADKSPVAPGDCLTRTWNLRGGRYTGSSKAWRCRLGGVVGRRPTGKSRVNGRVPSNYLERTIDETFTRDHVCGGCLGHRGPGVAQLGGADGILHLR